MRRTLHHDGYLCTYFHPWEFYDLQQHPVYRLSIYIRHHSGQQMVCRLDRLIGMLLSRDHRFVTFSEYLQTNHANDPFPRWE